MSFTKLGTILCLALLFFSIGCSSKTTIDPPAMIPRPIAPEESYPGTSLLLDFPAEGTVTLFIPDVFKPNGDGATEATYHFHGATWFAIEEHLRRGLDKPLVALELGQGSTVYKNPFLDRDQFGELMAETEKALRTHFDQNNIEITNINLTSFSAGYGSIREIVKVPEYVDITKRIILADSSYASLQEEPLEENKRVVAKPDYQSWVDFGKIAITGEKTLVMLSSDIKPEPYAGTMEVCRAVAIDLGIEIQSIEPNSLIASNSELEYPLHTIAEKGSFFWWGYGGDDPVVHMTIARRIAEAWIVLDEAGMP